MDITEARATLARIQPPPLMKLSIEEIDNPARTAAEMLIDLGRKLKGVEPTTEVTEAAAKLGPEKLAKVTIEHSQLTWDRDGNVAPGRGLTEGGLNISVMDAEQLIDAVALLIMGMIEGHFRHHYKVDGKLIYRMDTEQGQMRWDAFGMYAQNHPLPPTNIEHGNDCHCGGEGH